MSCPAKYADLHKASDDAFSKDYIHGFLNTKLSQNYCMADFGNGTATLKLNHNAAAASTKSEMEFKHKGGNFFGLNMAGITTTKTLTDSGMFKQKMEGNCSMSGMKLAGTTEWDMGSQENKANVLEMTMGRDKLSANMKVSQSGGLAMPGKVDFNAVVAATDAVKIGAAINYGIAKGDLAHQVKLVHSADKHVSAITVKNGQDLELVNMGKVNKAVTLPFGSVNVDNLHVRTQYGLKSADWGSQLCLEGNCQMGGFTTNKSRFLFNAKSLDYLETHDFKLNDSLNVIVSGKSNFKGGFFNNYNLGCAMNFSA